MPLSTPVLRQAVPAFANLALGEKGSLDLDPATGTYILEIGDQSWGAVVTVRASTSDTPQIGASRKTVSKTKQATQHVATEGVAILYTWVVENTLYMVCADAEDLERTAEQGGTYAASDEMLYTRRDRFAEARTAEATIFTARWNQS